MVIDAWELSLGKKYILSNANTNLSKKMPKINDSIRNQARLIVFEDYRGNNFTVIYPTPFHDVQNYILIL